MEARWALAFVARREGRVAMEASRWRHVVSLELGWMAPREAARYIEACQTAGLLLADEGLLRLAFDPKSVEVPRGFRPDPSDLPRADAAGGAEVRAGPEVAAHDDLRQPGQHAAGPEVGPSGHPSGAHGAAGEVATGPGDLDAGPRDAEAAGGSAPDEPLAESSPILFGGFSDWLPHVAEARGQEVAATLEAVEALQDRTGGLLHAEAALLVLAAEAGLDVIAAARSALQAMQKQA